jgi:DNA polymerase-1
MKKALIVDGNSIINRAFYGVKPLTTKDGRNTNAVFGMITMISKQLDAIKPDYAAVAFDLKAPTFRHKMFEQYKAGRHATPPELSEQFPVAKECFAHMGFKVLELEGYEADDILGTLARQSEKSNISAYVMTGDRDSLQLISDTTAVLLATNKDTLLMDRAAFFEQYGVMPEQFVDVKALMGDSSDNIPGVPGIGEKTALKLISEMKSLNGIYEDIDSAPVGPSAKQKLIDGKDSAYLSQKLARIECEVPLGVSLDDIEYCGIKTDELYRMFKDLEFTSLIKKFGLSSSKKPSVATPELPIIESDSQSALSKLKGSEFSLFDGDGYWDFCNGSEILRLRVGVSEFGDIFSNQDYHPICHDLKTISRKLLKENISFTNCAFDTMLACYILSPGESHYSLEKCITEYLKSQYDENTVSHKILLLAKLLKAKIEESSEFELLEKIEIPLAQVLAEMEDIGFKVDGKGLRDFAERLTRTENELCDRIYIQAGCEFNINSPKQLGDVLFVRLGIPAGKKTKSGYSTSADILEKLSSTYPIVSDILEYRQVTKLKNTYAIGLSKLAQTDARIHSTFNQTGTATGRLSSSEPNLQNIPIRTPLGREMRHFFVAEDGYTLIDADYSQIELRLLAHISGDPVMTQAFISGEDIHASTASAVFRVPLNAVTDELRKRAKAVNFGIVYGIGDFSLASDLHISRKQADEYIKSYLEKFSGVDNYLKSCVESAYSIGYTQTIFGRRRYIPELKAQNKNIQKFGERVAMNSPIQGSAADIIKIAMIRVRDRLKSEGIDARIILQVHDELIIEANINCAEKARDILKDEMENAVSLSVPLPVDIAIGKTWFETK